MVRKPYCVFNIIYITFWSPNLIWRRAFLETFILHKNKRISSLWLVLFVPEVFTGRPNSHWIAWWSCLSIISYTLSPWIRRSSCKRELIICGLFPLTDLSNKTFQDCGLKEVRSKRRLRMFDGPRMIDWLHCTILYSSKFLCRHYLNRIVMYIKDRLMVGGVTNILIRVKLPSHWSWWQS